MAADCAEEEQRRWHAIMPLPLESLPLIEDLVGQLATESILAQCGRDDNLVPAFSLLGELRELCSGEPALAGPIVAQHQRLERLLDAAQPFDDGGLGSLRGLVEWLPDALRAISQGLPVPLPADPKASTVGAAPPPGTGGAAPCDVLIELNLEENRELLAEFHAETSDHLQQIEAALLALEQEPDGPEAINAVFRSFHTIKGNAGFLGIGPMQALAHEVESLLDLARNRRLSLTAPIITEILRSRDALSMLAQQVAVALESGQLPQTIIPVSHLIVAVRRLATASLGAEERASPPALGSGSDAPAVLTVAGIVVPAEPTASPVLESRPAKLPGRTAVSAAQTVRVNTAKLDSLMDGVGELAIVQSQLIETARGYGAENSALQRNVAQLSRITKDLQRTAMSLRMIPIKQTFQKMERLTRDLAENVGKKVAFVTAGEDTELDRTVVEEIADPLVHMVRNALDHGLEPAAERLAAGKTETGRLKLSAYHEGGSIVIEMQDDGRGLDPGKILAKARKQGLVDENTEPSREEILNLVFLPGFSTAEKITAVSGRGVGMDVVKRNVEKLRGQIKITSEQGAGCTFKIKLPLTMAIIDGLVVRVGDDRFILPSLAVQSALHPARKEISTVAGLGEVIDVRGHFVPIHALHARFGIPARAQRPWDGIVVLIEHSGKVSALLVDELVSRQEVVVKNLGALMQQCPGVAGGAILGDGNIALILDPGGLMQAA
jgi:two-component system, chemotaxis family, sensor kinase CheA